MDKVELKYISPELFVSKSVAIVGSSETLLDSNFGKEIDEHDEVIRFNRAPTEGFEEHVGSKTTIRFANQHVFQNIPVDGDHRFDKVKDKYPRNFIKNQRDINIVNLGGSSNEGWSNRHENIDESCNSFLVDFNDLNKGHNQLYTVGFYTIMIFVESGIVPDLYGFGITEGGSSSHYWVNRGKESLCHDYNSERGTLKTWESEGKIKINL